MEYLDLDIYQVKVEDMFFVELKNLCGVEIHSQYVEDDEQYIIKNSNWPHSLGIRNGFYNNNSDTFGYAYECIRKKL